MNNIEKMEDLKSKYCNDTMNGNIWYKSRKGVMFGGD